MFTVAVVGAGGMGRTHLNNLQKMEDVKIDSICDPNPDASALARDVQAAYYADLDDMLRNTEAQIVIICTPTFLHTRQIKAVLRSGRHCISEKPLCLSSRQAEELFGLAREKQVQLYVGQVLHFCPEYQILAEIIQSGRYGKVIDAFFYRLTEKPKWSAGSWLFDSHKSGLIPYDLHIHELDFIVSQFGKPCGAHLHEAAREDRRREHCRFLYTYNDLTVCAEASWYNAPIPFTQGYRLCFERAVVVLENKSVTVYENGTDGGKVLMVAGGDDNGTKINVTSSLPYQDEIAHFLRCAAENRASDIVKNETILAVLETLESV